MLSLLVVMAILMLLIPCYSQYEQGYHERFAFIYGDGLKLNTWHNLINVTGLSLSIANNELYVVFCDETKKKYSIKQNAKHYLNIDFDKNNFQLIINEHIICRKQCDQNNLKLNEIAISDKQQTETVQIWSIQKKNIDRHLLELAVNDSAEDAFINTFGSTFDDTSNTSEPSSYEWWEFWKSEWWNNGWNTSKIITVSVILIVVIGFMAFIIGCCTYYSCKRPKKRYERDKNNKNNKNSDSNIKSSISNNNHYNTIQQDTDYDTDHEDNEAKSEEMKLNEKNHVKKSQVELQKTENEEKNKNENKDENKNENERESENDSESDSEALFGPGAADNGDIEMGTPFGTAGVMAYTMGSPGNDQQTDQQTLRSDSTATFMDKASIKSSMKAAEMTVGAPQNKQKINQQQEENKSPDTRKGDEEGFDWDIWLITTLKRCFPDDWAKYLSHFRKQRISEDILISLTIDKRNKGEIWKELIPVIGDRVRFQKAWENELMRRQLNKKI